MYVPPSPTEDANPKIFPEFSETTQDCKLCPTGKLIKCETNCAGEAVVVTPTKKDETDRFFVPKKLYPDLKVDDPVTVCDNCGHFALRSELHKERYCTRACEYSYHLDTDDLGISLDKSNVRILRGRDRRTKTSPSKTSQNDSESPKSQSKQTGQNVSEKTNGHPEIISLSKNSSRRSSKSSNGTGPVKNSKDALLEPKKVTEDVPKIQTSMEKISADIFKEACSSDKVPERTKKSPVRGMKRKHVDVKKEVKEESSDSSAERAKKAADLSLKKLKKKEYDAARIRRKSTAFHSAQRTRKFTDILNQRVPEPEVAVKRSVATRSGGVTNKPSRADFDWNKYMKSENTKAAPLKLFRKPAFPPENPFKYENNEININETVV